MKKILIMVMSCNQDFFNEQVETIKETWAKPIFDKKYDNIDIIFYKGTDDKNTYNSSTKELLVHCEDDLENTYKKTHYAFNLVNKNFEYDYIFRTNTSTFINIELLNYFVDSLTDDTILWTSDLYSLTEAATPYPLNIYGRGNGLLLSKKLINIILIEGIRFLYSEIVDDVIIGNILNSYWTINGQNYLDHIKGLTHGWYRSVKQNTNNNHQLSSYSSKENRIQVLKSFITIQVKNYENRNLENNHLKILYKLFENLNLYYDHKSCIDKINNYAKNPSVFIGSGVGYMNLDDWLNTDKVKLWYFELQHKTQDDEQYKNRNKKLY